MDTKILKYKDNLSKIDLENIKKVFIENGLVVFPTETVYGLGANGLSEEACEKIFVAKGRPSDNPLILHIANREQLYELVEEVPLVAEHLMDMFWPGPITFIFKASRIVPNTVRAGLSTVAIRMPSHEVARKILSYVNLPIAAPSANISGRPSPTTCNRVFEDLNNRVDIIVDGGISNIGIESTVVDVSDGDVTILRPGKITLEDIKIIVPTAKLDDALITDNDITPKSPGQKYKHYAPKAEAYCFVGNLSNVIKEINKRVIENKNKKIAILATEESFEHYENVDLKINLGSRENLEDIAKNLFEALRQCDDNKIDIIYAEGFELIGLGASIMNRLLKACSGRVIFGL